MTFLRRSITAVLLPFSRHLWPLLLLHRATPQKPIRVVVPFPAGGGTDIIAREVTKKFHHIGWSFVIENKPGSGGNLGVDAVAKAAPDGYTIALGQSSNLAINPSYIAKCLMTRLKIWLR